MILVALEAMATASRNDSSAASKMLTAILKSPMADIGKVAAPRDLAVQGQRKGASFPLFRIPFRRCLLAGEVQSFN